MPQPYPEVVGEANLTPVGRDLLIIIFCPVECDIPGNSKACADSNCNYGEQDKE